MINWLTDYLGTSSYFGITANEQDCKIVDVRNLVDKDGNKDDEIISKIDEGINYLKAKNIIIICCDYGMSRSNSIAAGIISKYESISFFDAVRLITEKVSLQGIKLEVLNSVYNAINPKVKVKGDIPRILITGGSGFIGTKLDERLNKSFFVKAISSKDINLITNPILLDLIIKENGINYLIHLANPRVYTLNIALGDSLVMLKNVLEACRLNQVKLCYISSWEVYSGYKSTELLADEALPLFPKGAYGESKWLSEQLIDQYYKLFDLKFTILRSSPIYGDNSDKPKFIYNFIDKATKDKPIVTHNYLNGSPRLDLLYVNDFLNALEKSLTFESNGIFNIGSGKSISTMEIADLIIAKYKSKSIVQSTNINAYYSNVKLDYTKALRELNWKPDFTFDQYLDRIKQNS
jgi:nucleoside-diphosphate-sugar epimerase